VKVYVPEITSPTDTLPEIETLLAVGAVGVEDTGLDVALDDGVLVPFALTADTRKL
jgi:hypothetical protein